jgi:hypothetical protein
MNLARAALRHALLLSSITLLGAISIPAVAVAGTPADCALPPVALANGDFESPAVSGAGATQPAPQTGWSTDDPADVLEFWNVGSAYEGDQFIELNATGVDSIWQSVATTPGQTLLWRVAHRSRSFSYDVMRAAAGADAGSGLGSAVDLVPLAHDGTALANGDPGAADPADLYDDDTAWGVWSGSYTVPPGQTTTRFGFRSITSNGPGIGNFIDAVLLAVPATACPDAADTVAGDPVGIAPLTNDLGSNLTATLTTQPAHGTVTEDPATHRFTYRAAAGFAGADSFTYTATDDFGHADTSILSITVAAPAPAPAAPPVPAPDAPAEPAEPAAITPAPQRGAPAACRSRRAVVLHWKVTAAQRLRRVSVAVDGRPRAHLRGSARAFALSMRGMPAGRVRVVIAARTTAGARLSSTRTYRLCSAAAGHARIRTVRLRRG